MLRNKSNGMANKTPFECRCSVVVLGRDTCDASINIHNEMHADFYKRHEVSPRTSTQLPHHLK